MKKAIDQLEKILFYIKDLGLAAIRDGIENVVNELKFRPPFETPEQREKRTGEKLNELTPVWVRHLCHDDWFWHLGTYEEEKENNKYFEESGYKCDMVIATEAGPPPDDWKPEETT